MQALELLVTGAVQGVGFRPFVYRLAHELGVGGAVWNEPRGVRIRAVGTDRAVEQFCGRLRADAPAPARVDAVQVLAAEEAPAPEVFRITSSDDTGERTAAVMADLATCPDCLREVFDPSNRRFRYPFTNCTRCGPRYSIVTGVPYDRPNTTMRAFTQCPACRAEYDNPADRRFHAQPNACPVCGPQLALWDPEGATRAARDEALRAAGAALREGCIVALKGLGGFQLLCDAGNEDAVRLLRRRKRREEKPFALMVAGLAEARALAQVGDLEADLLQSAAAPIVLLARRRDAPVAEAVAPGNPSLGLLLPTTPLHHLLLREAARAIVATSGNVSDEPLCTDEREALARLAGLADLFLVHDRPIARPVDDSVVRVMAGRPCVLRRARGYAPLPIPIALDAPPLLALGAHLKNTIALARGRQVVMSQHLGDLDTLEARSAFERAVADLQDLYGTRPDVWVADRHPDYAPNLWAGGQRHALVQVQHHEAHAAAAMAEHGIDGPALAVIWDGTGLGIDRTIWGGEWLRCVRGTSRRVAHLRTFLLPGGDAAAREPWRSALGVLAACGDGRADSVRSLLRNARLEDILISRHLEPVLGALERGTGCVATSSAGRLFDAVASLLRLRQMSTFEGQAAMAVEWAAASCAGRPVSLPPLVLQASDPMVLDWTPLIRALLDAQREGVATCDLASAFHDSLVEGIAAVAARAALRDVVLGGGCFQNRLLLERTVRRLRADGFTVHWPQLVPPNDGGISLGQAVVAAYGGT